MTKGPFRKFHYSVDHLHKDGTIADSLPRRWRDPFNPEPWAKRLKQFSLIVKKDERQLQEIRLAHFEGDPLADDLIVWMHQEGMRKTWPLFEAALNQGLSSIPSAPAPLAAFFSEIETMPEWLDRVALERACDFGQRTAWIARLISFSGLLSGYAVAGMTKPLVATRGLDELAEKRIAETTKFVVDVFFSRGMTRFSEGFKTTIRVRLMHAMVRHNLTAKDWDAESWGIPINQVDMAATLLGFSVTLLGGLRGFGFIVSPQQSRDFMLLWRYVGHLMGVDPRFNPKSELAGFKLLPLLVGSQQGPDQDSRALAHALLNILYSRWPQTGFGRFMARREMEFRSSIARVMAGNRLADELQLPKSYIGIAAVFSLIPGVFTIDLLQWLIPGGRALATKLGHRFLERHIAEILGDHDPSFRQVGRHGDLKKSS